MRALSLATFTLTSLAALAAASSLPHAGLDLDLNLREGATATAMEASVSSRIWCARGAAPKGGRVFEAVTTRDGDRAGWQLM